MRPNANPQHRRAENTHSTQAVLCKAAVVFICFVWFGCFCAAQTSEEPLGDVVRDSKTAHKAAHVFTNDEIPSVAVPVTEPSSPANAADNQENASKPDTPAVAEDKNTRGTKSGISVPGVLKNGTLDQARAALETLKHDREAFISNYDKIEKRLSETDDDALRQTYSDILASRESTLAKNAKAIADTENAIRAAQDADLQGGKNETQ